MPFSSNAYRAFLSAAALCVVSGSSQIAFAQGGAQSGARENRAEPQARKGPGRFRDGFFVGRFRRRGMYSSLTLGVSNCIDGRNGAKCRQPLGGAGEAKLKPSFAFTKEFGYRIPWALFGVSYSLGFMRPDWSVGGADPEGKDIAYQHSLLAVIRPTLPFWRFDLGMTIAPGWSRQVYRNEWTNRTYSQGFALGLGVVASVNITQSWIVGFRWDAISNFHSKRCVSTRDTDTTCVDLPDNTPSAQNMGLSGLFLSHRW